MKSILIGILAFVAGASVTLFSVLGLFRKLILNSDQLLTFADNFMQSADKLISWTSEKREYFDAKDKLRDLEERGESVPEEPFPETVEV